MRRSKVLFLGFAGLILIIVCCLLFKTAHIENDISVRAQSALSETIFPAVVLSVDGRDVSLTGTVGSTQEKEEAEKNLSAVYGIHAVNNMLEVLPQEEDAIEKNSVKTLIQDVRDGFSRIETVEFKTGKSIISPESEENLRNLASILINHPDIKIEIGGHADSSGDRDSNLILSKERANAVLAWLVQNNINQERLSAIGYGDTRPLADNSTSSGRRNNRRVTFKILEDG